VIVKRDGRNEGRREREREREGEGSIDGDGLVLRRDYAAPKPRAARRRYSANESRLARPSFARDVADSLASSSLSDATNNAIAIDRDLCRLREERERREEGGDFCLLLSRWRLRFVRRIKFHGLTWIRSSISFDGRSRFHPR